jgi:raffinose/stachyose/melibiose transport system substrate-binding protein
MRTSWCRRIGVTVVATVMTLSGIGCSAAEVAPVGATTEITLLVDDRSNTLKRAESVIEAFERSHPDITVKTNTRPGGSVGSNVVQTKLAAGEAEDVLWFDSGSAMRSLDPARYLLDLTDSSALADVDDAYRPAVTVNGKVYGAPWGESMAGGIVYNRKVYADLGLRVPLTWAQFVANNEAVEAAGIDPVIGAFADPWTTQVLLLGDFHNVLASSADWSERYSVNQVEYATDPVARRGFEKTADVAERGWLNADARWMTENQAMTALATGEGAHHPTLSDSVARLPPEQARDLGFFGVPGDDASAPAGATFWMPGGQYIPRSSTEVDAAMRFVAFTASPEGVAASQAAVPPLGPSFVTGAPRPDGALQVVRDVQGYRDRGTDRPALEFSAPVKGPSLAQITTALMGGQTSPVEAARQYDADVADQARQRGLPGW